MSTHADDVAALRDEISMLGSDSGFDMVAERMTAALDRIAARAPQRATDRDGDALWLHTCGFTRTWGGPEPTDGRLWCEWCSASPIMATEWRALYVLPGGA
jgi:hypothetical protein